MPRKLAILLSLAFAVVHAEAQTPPTAIKPAPAKEATKARVVPPSTSEAENSQNSDLIPRTVFDVLVGEMALQRGNIEMALGAWVDLARRSQDPKVFARAIEISTLARQNPLVLDLARQWVRVDPESVSAQQTYISALILNNRNSEIAAPFAKLLAADKENLAGNLLRLPHLIARSNPDKKAAFKQVEELTQPYVGIAEAHAALALSALFANDTARANSEATQAQQLRPDWEYAAILVAQSLARDSNTKAIDHLASYLDNYPGAAEVRLTLGRLLIGEKRYAEADTHFKRLIEERPMDPDVLFPASVLALQSNDRDGARKLLLRILNTRFPDRSAVHYLLGQIDEEDKNLDAALGHYGQVVAGERFLAARGRVAAILSQQGKLDAALKSLRDTVAKTPAERIQLSIAEASLLRDAKRYDDSFKVLEAVLRTHPDDPELLYEAGMSAEKVGKYEAMEAHLAKLIKLKPDHAHALNALGYSLADRNIRLDEAARMIERAAKLAPQDAFIMDSLGWVQFRQGRLQEALTTLENAFRLRADPEIAAHLGEVLWQLNRRDEALKVWKTASSTFPENDVLNKVMQRFAQ